MCKPRPDLQDVTVPNGDLICFVDGRAKRSSSGDPVASYAVCTPPSIEEAARLPSYFSAQAAELFALTHAFVLGKGQSLTVYTDSQCALGVCHIFWNTVGNIVFSSTQLLNQ